MAIDTNISGTISLCKQSMIGTFRNRSKRIECIAILLSENWISILIKPNIWAIILIWKKNPIKRNALSWAVIRFWELRILCLWVMKILDRTQMKLIADFFSVSNTEKNQILSNETLSHSISRTSFLNNRKSKWWCWRYEWINQRLDNT